MKIRRMDVDEGKHFDEVEDIRWREGELYILHNGMWTGWAQFATLVGGPPKSGPLVRAITFEYHSDPVPSTTTDPILPKGGEIMEVKDVRD